MLSVTYIFHSCFAIEAERCVLIVDYWQDNAQGYVAEVLKTTDKPVYFLASHFHDDHFNREIMAHDARFILSHDILKHRRAEQNEQTIFLRRGDVYEDENVRITACPSTDVGCSFAIEVDGHRLFHAGDLSDWQMPREDGNINRKMQGDYLAALRHIRERFEDGFEVAMLPVDPRLETNAWLGVREWLDRIPTQHLMPMHYVGWGGSLLPIPEDIEVTTDRVEL